MSTLNKQDSNILGLNELAIEKLNRVFSRYLF